MWMFNLIIQVQREEPLSSSYGRKAVNWEPLNRMANIYKMWQCEESLKTTSSRPILIYFEFRSKRSLITVIWMDPHSPKKFIATKYCFLILGDNTSFFFFISFFVSLFFVFMLCYLFCYYKFLQILFSIYCSFYYYYYLLLLFLLIFLFNEWIN